MAGQHSTCVDEVDELLRGDVLMNLFRAVRQGLRASVESYSIKKLEPFYEYKRDVNLPDANLALHAFQTVLAFGPREEHLDEIKNAITCYNRDDCVSALRLRDWLERLRNELEAQTGEPLPRREPKDGAPSETSPSICKESTWSKSDLPHHCLTTKKRGRNCRKRPHC
jgi:uncharacterized protein